MRRKAPGGTGCPAGRLWRSWPSWTRPSEEQARETPVGAKADFQDEAAALELAYYTKAQFDLNMLRTALKAIGAQVRRNLITGKLEVSNMPAAYSEEGAANILPTVLWDLMKPFHIKGASITAVQKGRRAGGREPL